MTDYPECPVCGAIQDRDIFDSEETIDVDCHSCATRLTVWMKKTFHVYLDDIHENQYKDY